MYWDIHCHADKVDKERIEEAVKMGIKIGAVSMDYEGALKILNLKKEYPENIEVFLGIHPEVDAGDSEVTKVIELINENKGVLAGIGEVGIPYFYLEDKSEDERKRIKAEGDLIMEGFVEAAVKYSLPLNLHVVEDDIDLALPILERYSVEGALFHWYEGSEVQLKKIEEAGHFISVSPWIFVEEHYLDFVRSIPLKMLLLESDGPCEYNGQKGEPQMILQVVKKLAVVYEMEYEELLKVVKDNTRRYLRR